MLRIGNLLLQKLKYQRKYSPGTTFYPLSRSVFSGTVGKNILHSVTDKDFFRKRSRCRNGLRSDTVIPSEASESNLGKMVPHTHYVSPFHRIIKH